MNQWQVERVPSTVEALLSGRALESRQSVRRWNWLLMEKVSQCMQSSNGVLSRREKRWSLTRVIFKRETLDLYQWL